MKAVLFDLDGTLLNTLADIRYYVNETLRSFSDPEISEEQARTFVGDGAKRLIERSLPQGATNLEECYLHFKEHFAKSENERTTLYEGEMQVLTALKEAGYQLGVVTNKPQDATEGCIQKFFPQGFFDYVGGDSGMFPIKPDPTPARFAALYLRVAPLDCVFVGDGETDVLTAKNAGMRGISTLWGYRTKQQLQAVGANAFASSFEELGKILQKF